MEIKEKKFNEEMVRIYKNAKTECNYNAIRFLQMLSEYGGLKTAKILLKIKKIPDGFIELWNCKRLDLSVEALVLKVEYENLFNKAEKEEAIKRLKEYGYEK